MPHFTLTSDFGPQNAETAAIHGKILSHFSPVTISEISCSLMPFNLQQAVYLFRQAYRHFPPGSFHFVYCDLYAREQRKLLYAFENRQHIFCADNGFLTMLFDDQPARFFELEEKPNPYQYLTVTDAFLLQCRMLQEGQTTGLKAIGVENLLVRHSALAAADRDTMEAQVLHIDHYGNVVLNVRRDHFEEIRSGRQFRISFMRGEELQRISLHYNDVPEGNTLCHFNTAGYLELSVNKGSAADLFGYRIKQDRHLLYHTIKIFFA